MRIFTTTRRKVVSGVIAAGFVLAMVPALHAFADWGPARTTFTWANPATYVTFNSITDNPQAGDERKFYGVADVNATQYVKSINVQDNEELSLRIYYHNDAASNLNLVATNTRVRFALPSQPATSTWSTAHISADNANPRDVADTVDFTGARPFTLSYETGSAQLWNNVFRGAQLSDSIVTSSGALIGYDKLDGNVPGCNQYSGYVTIKVRVHMTPPPVQPVYSCNLLTVTSQGDRAYKYSVDATAQNGATITGYTFDFGDGHSADTSSNTTTHTYAKDGTYTTTATVKFNVNDSQKTAACSKTITVSTPPVTPPPSTPPSTPPVTTLPKTGASDILGIFAGASAFGGVGHYVVSRRRRG